MRLAPDILIDRHYRGAIVMRGVEIFALPEEAVRVLEVLLAGRALSARQKRALHRHAPMLLEAGILVRAGSGSDSRNQGRKRRP